MLSPVLVRSRAAYQWTSESPNFTDFQAWVASGMGVPAANMPDLITLEMAYDTALNVALDDLGTIPYQPGTPSIYALAVYNLGGAFLASFALDVPPATYWSDLRTRLGIDSFSYTIITGASDQGTSKTGVVPAFVNQMGPMDFFLTKTPWGNMYLVLAGSWGAVWGIS